MKHTKPVQKVEWLDSHCIGHSIGAYYRQHGLVTVEVRITGSVLLDDVEYIVDDVVEVEVDKSNLRQEKPS